MFFLTGISRDATRIPRIKSINIMFSFPELFTQNNLGPKNNFK